MNNQVPASELHGRMERFRLQMDLQNPQWETALIFSKVNLLYFTGSMPEGLLLITRGGDATLWVKRSLERTLNESLFSDIRPMESYRDVAAAYPAFTGNVYLETEFVPLAMFQRLQKSFPFSGVQSLDSQIGQIRSVKSEWEMRFMEEAGIIHRRVMEERVPQLLREGMTELEFAGEVYKVMLEEGHMGTARFNMFDTEMVVGQIGFGESSIYPTSFNGPGGNFGMNPAMPGLGSRHHKLKTGDLVFLDMGLAVNGYHTDKTMTYMFGRELPAEVLEIHHQCVDIQNRIAEMLKPGNIPADIYETVMAGLKPEFQENFMGFGKRQVKFLGHGIGLTVDEIPVLAKGFNEPLQENVVLAVEPKKGIKGVGMVGIENTFVVTANGGRCLTGSHPGMMLVKG